jgi:hypothetical protein
MLVVFRVFSTLPSKMAPRFPFLIPSVNLCEKTLFVMQSHPAEQTVDKPTDPADTLESADPWRV